MRLRAHGKDLALFFFLVFNWRKIALQCVMVSAVL